MIKFSRDREYCSFAVEATMTIEKMIVKSKVRLIFTAKEAFEVLRLTGD